MFHLVFPLNFSSECVIYSIAICTIYSSMYISVALAMEAERHLPQGPRLKRPRQGLFLLIVCIFRCGSERLLICISPPSYIFF